MRSPQRLLLLPALALVISLAPPARLTSEAAPRTKLEFAREGHARIPFELRSQHVWVRGRVSGKDSVWIVVDTGASTTVLDQSVARALGLKTLGEHETFGGGGSQRGTTVEGATIELPGLALRRSQIESIDLSAITRQTGRPMQVILGYELFQNCVVRFDYPAGVMDVWEKSRAPRTGAGSVVPMTLDNNLPYIDATLTVPGRPPLTGRYVIDTGSTAALLLAPEVTARESLATAFPRTLVTMARGVGGEVKNLVGRAQSFAIGDLVFPSPTVVMPDSSGGRISVLGSIGNIGGQILGRCAVTFDYPHQRIRFEPGPGFDRPFESDKSGVAMSRTADGLVVKWVNVDTPASEAGLQVGDVVATIDGEPSASVDPSQLRLRFQQEGRVVRLAIRRGDETLEKTLTLRKLL